MKRNNNNAPIYPEMYVYASGRRRTLWTILAWVEMAVLIVSIGIILAVACGVKP